MLCEAANQTAFVLQGRVLSGLVICAREFWYKKKEWRSLFVEFRAQ